uniref:Threonine synthase like 1 n=1 Tax=Lepisosteus oculatus TaxID=7918 RepID=W5NNL3_LEPOC|nr:PREDICTED: threonine synthase-like 1 [Lepisosteus oculatus]XP_015209425.1 PREDICTED: threonine synthase-like 1 [Lepisosteus oculatus]XP_015209426.1 PREDICTED: threonine synthase-like 1 [Lepisosteus oculatus]XP_015209427.1 PREDICTED: threonine synthase-like 1 [Lepisosteus oculatus]
MFHPSCRLVKNIAIKGLLAYHRGRASNESNSRLLTRKTFFSPIVSFSASRTASLSSCTGHKNIFIMGLPGSGKTTVGNILGSKLGHPVIDLDDHILKKEWNMTAGEKLSEIGWEQFVEEEGKALSSFSASGSIVLLTESSPMHSAAMHHVKQNGIVIYLDVNPEVIIKRLSGGRGNRIVGRGSGVSLREILRCRRKIYNKWCDARVLCDSGDSAEEVAANVLKAVKRCEDTESEVFVSTRNKFLPEDGSVSERKFFSDFLVEGLAPDGGLYVPQGGLSELPPREWVRLVDLPYSERAQILLEKCIHPADVPAPELYSMVKKAYADNFACPRIAPVRHLVHNQYVQELFHGPTASFRDFSLLLLPQLLAYCTSNLCNHLLLGATSGDTGSAALNGFSRLPEAEKRRSAVLVFFPEAGVSPVQRLQMTGFREGNLKAVGVQSDLAFCQQAVRQMLGDPKLTGHLAVECGAVLTAADSVNWAQLLPQVIFHASAYLDLVSQGTVAFGEPVDVCIPAGDFGNILSAVYAKQMGIPIRKFICASHQSGVLTKFMRTGEYDLRDRQLLPSSSPATEVLKPSSLERYLFHISDGDWQLVRGLFSQFERERYFKVPRALLKRMHQDCLAGWCSEEECLAAISAVHSATGYILDTRAAAAKVVADRLQDRTCPVIISSTVHPAKFAPAVLKALKFQDVAEDPFDQLNLLSSLGSLPPMHADLKSLRDPRRHKVCDANVSDLVEEVETVVRDSFLKVT